MTFRSLAPLVCVCALAALPTAVEASVASHASPTLAQRADAAGCGTVSAGEHCGPGNNRRTAGGNGKVSHGGWPAISGIFWFVTDDRGHTRVGTDKADELLGLNGSDHLVGGGGRDVLWGDQSKTDNTGAQHDVLSGGAGGDFIYTSHGTNTVFGGPGNDHIFAYYGHGTIDCGSGYDTVRLMPGENNYTTRNCEHVRHY